jgi:manganese/iron transport system ATP-binding protein
MTRDKARIDIEHISVSYNGQTALDDLTLQIAHGARVAVVGPNGAGKSTLFKVLVGEITPAHGRIRIHGRSLGSHKDCVAYVPQREEIDWHFPVTVEDVVMMGRFGKQRWLRKANAHDREIVQRSLHQIEIGDLAQRSISDLSGGQQQRVFMARALAQEPHILLLDEPFNGIDAPTQEAILGLLNDLRTKDVTILVSTHDLNLASDCFDQVILINKRLIAFGTPKQVFTRPHIQQAFADRVMIVDGHAVVDDCCPPPDDPARSKV